MASDKLIYDKIHDNTCTLNDSWNIIVKICCDQCVSVVEHSKYFLSISYLKNCNAIPGKGRFSSRDVPQDGASFGLFSVSVKIVNYLIGDSSFIDKYDHTCVCIFFSKGLWEQVQAIKLIFHHGDSCTRIFLLIATQG